MIEAEESERQCCSNRYQMGIAKFPLARDGFLEQKLNLLLIGGTGMGKTHLAVALGGKPRNLDDVHFHPSNLERCGSLRKRTHHFATEESSASGLVRHTISRAVSLSRSRAAADVLACDRA